MTDIDDNVLAILCAKFPVYSRDFWKNKLASVRDAEREAKRTRRSRKGKQ